MRTREQIYKEADELKSQMEALTTELKNIGKATEPTSTRLERLGFYDKGGDYHALDMDNSLCLFYRDQETGELTVGNSYKTEEDAQAAAKRREIMADLWRNSKKYEWAEYTVYENFYLVYNSEYNKIESVTEDQFWISFSTPYFTREKAQEMIDKWGDDLKLLNV